MLASNKLLSQSKTLLDEKRPREAIALLTDDILVESKDARLYYNKALAFDQLRDFPAALELLQRTIELNPGYTNAYIVRGAIRDEMGLYQEALDDYNRALLLDPANSLAYANRGMVYSRLNEYQRALQDFDTAIRLDNGNAHAYLGRGNLLYDREQYAAALNDYRQTIALNPTEALAHYNACLVLSQLGHYEQALDAVNISINLDSNYRNSYYARALVYRSLKRYQEAITDLEHFMRLVNNPNDYWSKVAASVIEDLRTKMEHQWYDEIDDLVTNIRRMLLYPHDLLTHYTSLSGARAMIVDKSPFRISEGSFLNDTSEGRELFSYLDLGSAKKISDETVAVDFTEKPFIGSFVADSKHDDLTLWRMYGKEGQQEAKGCALTINRSQFISDLKNSLTQKESTTGSTTLTNLEFTFYKVAYKQKNRFIIPGVDQPEQERFNALLQQLKTKISSLTDDEKSRAIRLINDIAYLFKLSEYQHESEVRLVIPGAGFKKLFGEIIPPRVYIELAAVVPSLYKITLGPKVERSDEWAATFNYSIKEQFVQREQPVIIVMSHLPFK